MKLFVVLAALLAGCLAQKPHPCKSPPLMTGALTVSTQNERLWVYAKYMYDALGQRLRLYEFVSSDNKTFTYDLLMLYREHIMYQIFDNNSTCTLSPLAGDFVPISIPKGASLLGQVVLGSSSGPGQGLLVNTWTGDYPGIEGKFMMTMTEFGCIPVSLAVHTKEYGWMVVSYFNNVIGLSDPSLLNPPSFCPGKHTAADSDKEPVDFFKLVPEALRATSN
ncbi:ependymin-1-like isoform X3 [Notolabrus celidotus]|uniref:ependymin-1-like isoform X3 n=1 Tax=Notolabrus celidotus TaxID=1203425 RepID=UPI0014905D51|nr:ependymin-1-like isoform X3 [Notolabrus celidotus]